MSRDNSAARSYERGYTQTSSPLVSCRRSFVVGCASAKRPSRRWAQKLVNSARLSPRVRALHWADCAAWTRRRAVRRARSRPRERCSQRRPFSQHARRTAPSAPHRTQRRSLAPAVWCSTPDEQTRETRSDSSANRIGQADASAAPRRFVAQSPGARLPGVSQAWLSDFAAVSSRRIWATMRARLPGVGRAWLRATVGARADDEARRAVERPRR
jgi:hypothetical protein